MSSTTTGDASRCAAATAAIDLAALAASAQDTANLPEGMSPGLGEHVLNITDVFTFPSGCHVAEVEIDPETGATDLLRYTAVDDYGRLINPMLTEGQVQGGLAQGIGRAMLEHTVYDPRLGPAPQRLADGLHAAARNRPAVLRHRTGRAADRRQSARASRARARPAASAHRRP